MTVLFAALSRTMELTESTLNKWPRALKHFRLKPIISKNPLLLNLHMPVIHWTELEHETPGTHGVAAT